MMDVSENRFKTALKNGQRQIGLWSAFASPNVAEVLGGCGFDWIVLDMEHAPAELPVILDQHRAMATGTATPVVRPPWNDFVTIKRILDSGIQSLLIPYVENKEEAEAAVRAVRYPPHGNRGVAGSTRAAQFGRNPGYLANAHRQICLLLQVESLDALSRLEDIASVDGVDGIFIGPNDLAASMGHLGQQTAEPVQAEIRKAAERLNKIGVPSGIVAGLDEDIRRYMEWGFQFVAVGQDVSLLARTAEGLVKKYRG